MTGLALGGLAPGQRREPGQQVGRDELRGHVPAEIVHGEQPGQPGDQGSGARTHPMRRPPQTLLLSEPTEITAVAVSGQRRRHRCAGERQLAEHLIVDQRQAGVAAVRTSARRASADSTEPVGLWNVEIT